MSDEKKLSDTVAGGPFDEPTFEATPEVQKKKRPSIRVRAKGRISGLMDQLGALYKARNPDRDCRWVYAPTHKPELSNVISRRAQGYTEVTFKELPEAADLMRGLGSDDAVRVGDVILMSIERELREIFKAELQEDALEQGKRVERSYYEKIGALEGTDSQGEVHKSTPKGAVKIEVKTKEYEFEQRTSDEEGG